ncbi:hypothetical protein HMPREF9123_1276 [Neisseria bacilliformis ATCC BAA-1200]|uniref:Uncharacterized protein n=1 Tax=Neisseria bacilliformis ATCC BAA-1200 TaxID=888742 RepID=F2BC21_9NEIS|nr:hypothetical protein HMPREF9123_1276 [Neisseria bacilliformis ATCC BAA-1200]
MLSFADAGYGKRRPSENGAGLFSDGLRIIGASNAFLKTQKNAKRPSENAAHPCQKQAFAA